MASCLRIGLSIQDMKQLTYIEVMKMFLSYLDEEEPKVRQATQRDWDILAGG